MELFPLPFEKVLNRPFYDFINLHRGRRFHAETSANLVKAGATLFLRSSNLDGFEKPICCVSLLPSSLRRTISTPRSSGFGRLAYGAFSFAVRKSVELTFLRLHQILSFSSRTRFRLQFRKAA